MVVLFSALVMAVKYILNTDKRRVTTIYEVYRGQWEQCFCDVTSCGTATREKTQITPEFC